MKKCKGEPIVSFFSSLERGDMFLMDCAIGKMLSIFLSIENIDREKERITINETWWDDYDFPNRRWVNILQTYDFDYLIRNLSKV